MTANVIYQVPNVKNKCLQPSFNDTSFNDINDLMTQTLTTHYIIIIIIIINFLSFEVLIRVIPQVEID